MHYNLSKDVFGSGGIKVITGTFNKNKLTVTRMIIFDMTTFSIRGNLRSLLTSSSRRIALLWAEPIYATFTLQNALDCDVFGP